MSDKYQALRDALNSEVTSGPWIADDNEGFSPWAIWSRMSPTGHGNAGPKIAQIHGDSAEGDANAAYIAAASPATITALLADLDAEKARLRWLISQHWVEPEAVFRLNLSGTDDAEAYEQEAYAAIDTALSQIKAAGREQA